MVLEMNQELELVMPKSQIFMNGITTQNSPGYVLDTDVTVFDGIHGLLIDQVMATYNSDEGDSGALIYKVIQDRYVQVFGQHVGKFCSINLSGENNPDRSDFIDYCFNDTRPEYKRAIFSHWDNVKSNLGIGN